MQPAETTAACTRAGMVLEHHEGQGQKTVFTIAARDAGITR
ncbi:hypothetical protein O3W44_21690 [Pantoea sp. LMR881]|nr:hypothetical protein [Pantoea sp. LMR881]MCZ4061148.1 hypothetical protein [Pantoea sp. LMR881]